MRHTSFIILTTMLLSCYLRVNGESPPPPPPVEAASPPPPPPSGTPPAAVPATSPPAPPPGPHAEPVQQKCPELKALKSGADPSDHIIDWVVGRVSQVKDVAAAKIDPNINTCSIFTHYEGCGAIHYSVTNDATDPKTIFHANIYAFHVKANNLVHYEETFTKEEPEFRVRSIKLNKMEEIAQDLTIKEINPIPDAVKAAQEKMVASIAVDPAGKWFLHSTCTTESKTTWVSFSKKELEAAPDPKAYIESFAQEIDKHLADIQLKPEDVPMIETKLGFEPPKTAGPGAVPDEAATSPAAPPAEPPAPATSPSPPAVSPPPPPPPPASDPPPP